MEESCLRDYKYLAPISFFTRFLTSFCCINNALMNYVTGKLHSGMCNKSKLNVYKKLKGTFECKKYQYLYGVSDRF